jgi:hypothetical protein
LYSPRTDDIRSSSRRCASRTTDFSPRWPEPVVCGLSDAPARRGRAPRVCGDQLGHAHRCDRQVRRRPFDLRGGLGSLQTEIAAGGTPAA